MPDVDDRLLTAGVDIGSSSVKSAVVLCGARGDYTILSSHAERLRHRDVKEVAAASLERCIEDCGAPRSDISYIASTGEGEMIESRTGHFYGMTAHGRGGLALAGSAAAVLDVGALHARAIVIDPRGRVVRYRMTSQCASGSGQFLENIARYLGVALEEIGPLSLTSDAPEKCSSICAVLAETDVINMVSRCVSIPNILKGIHVSMAGRFVKLLDAAQAKGIVTLTGGLAADAGLLAALEEESRRGKSQVHFVTHPLAVLAGALGAALWGAFRVRKLRSLGAPLQLM